MVQLGPIITFWDTFWNQTEVVLFSCSLCGSSNQFTKYRVLFCGPKKDIPEGCQASAYRLTMYCYAIIISFSKYR